MPCSGPNIETKVKPFALEKSSAVLVRLESTLAGFATRPTRRPASDLKFSSRSTSMPKRIDAGDAADGGGGAAAGQRDESNRMSNSGVTLRMRRFSRSANNIAAVG